MSSFPPSRGEPALSRAEGPALSEVEGAGMGGMIQATARGLRRRPTEAERLLWRHLRLRQVGGYRFRRQQPLGPYIVDFVCLEKRLIVEVDGGQHAAQVEKDAQRAAWLEADGFRLLRFWNSEVLQDTQAVQETIRAALDASDCPPSSVLPRKGEGGTTRSDAPKKGGANRSSR